LDQGEWVPIFYRNSVQGPIIHAEAKASTRLTGEEYGGGSRRGTWPNKALGQILIQEFLKDLKLILRHVVEGAIARFLTRLKLNFVVAGPMGR
jgi:hypothetical protein